MFGVDTQLIADGSYFVAEARADEKENAEEAAPVIVGCGGWSRRKTLYGGDVWAGGARTYCSVPRRMRQRYEPFLFIQIGRGVELEG